MKEFAEQRIAAGDKTLVVDIGACSGMDSTFMGMLAGFAIQFRKAGDTALAVVGTSPKNRASFKELGLHHLLAINPDGAPWADRMDEARSNMTVIDPKAVADQESHIRESHENLCAADQSNLEKFAAVLEMLGSKMPRP
jgi:hypothetical protein